MPLQAIKKLGAKKVIAACAHAVLSGPALKRINDSYLEEIVTTDTRRGAEVKQ